MPVIANVDFGHTDPKVTFPIGGEAKITVKNSEIKIEIINH
jgi:muramoyltetrapeptide carboxypeptidase LdcA involved in peptidoglycan recycling